MTISATFQTFQLCNAAVNSVVSQQKICGRGISSASCTRSLKIRSSRVAGNPRTTCAPKASIGIYYTTGTCNTEKAAKNIKENFGLFAEEATQIRAALPTDLAAHDGIVLGVPSYLWDEYSPVSGLDFDSIMPPISNTEDDLKDVKVAIFALGDQVGYPGSSPPGSFLEFLASSFVGNAPTQHVKSTCIAAYCF
ncbi:hypothetical protein CYMTET_35049 [Cymbomonas tetramitiformis]|uniref:Flavodoxin-like domain-containing protein n=1 Tax=Cymbomonas tetramitiformis TaxID=36881 RepID=A0AAE0F9W0_9CHLO|nr:hypothetical protein CYMTET_35049 [Cymbomonas tetramitiformis]